MAYFPGLLMK